MPPPLFGVWPPGPIQAHHPFGNILGRGGSAREGSREAAGALRFGEELQRFILKTQVCGGSNMMGEE